jgi:hypothetical protein
MLPVKFDRSCRSEESLGNLPAAQARKYQWKDFILCSGQDLPESARGTRSFQQKLYAGSKSVSIQRLFKEVCSSHLQGPDGRLHIREACDYDDRHPGCFSFGLFQELYAVHTRHYDVGDQQLTWTARQLLQTFSGIGKLPDLGIHSLQHPGHGFETDFFVVDNEYDLIMSRHDVLLLPHAEKPDIHLQYKHVVVLKMAVIPQIHFA